MRSNLHLLSPHIFKSKTYRVYYFLLLIVSDISTLFNPFFLSNLSFISAPKAFWAYLVPAYPVAPDIDAYTYCRWNAARKAPNRLKSLKLAWRFVLTSCDIYQNPVTQEKILKFWQCRTIVYYTISDESAWKIALWSRIVYTIFSNVAYENESQF
jgi:hypothetical protein